MPIRAVLAFAACFALWPSPLPAAPRPGGPVYLLQPGANADLVVATTALAAAAPDALVLVDSAAATPYLNAFLADWKPSRLVRVGTGQGGLLEELFPTAAEVIVAPREPLAGLLQAACLAGVRRVPLIALDARQTQLPALLDALGRWQPQRVTLVGEAARIESWLGAWKCARLPVDKLEATHLRELPRPGTLVLTNPHDPLDAPLAAWIALQKGAALRFTNAAGSDASEVVERALHAPKLARIEYLILAGSPRAIPPEMRPNPLAADKDRQIECEPTTPRAENTLCSLAVGRLFHPDRAVVPLLLARQHYLTHDLRDRAPRVLIASNVGGGLPLLEMFSRATVAECRNAGWGVTATVGQSIDEDELRMQMRRHDIFLWEGHQSTLIRDWGYPRWAESTPPQLVVLQSCLALEEAKVLPILARGAVGVVGTSTRMYSGSGGAASLAFFDALIHDQQPLGAALRQAKNFLLAYAQLKEQRLEAAAARTGANVRAAWTFTLWGDPTFTLAGKGTPRIAPIRATSNGDRVTVSIPSARLPEVSGTKYRASLPANGRLAGLLRAAEQGKPQEMVPLVYAEFPLKSPGAGYEPRLTGSLASGRRVLLYDPRRERGVLVLIPSTNDEVAYRFRVQWEAPE